MVNSEGIKLGSRANILLGSFEDNWRLTRTAYHGAGADPASCCAAVKAESELGSMMPSICSRKTRV